jgi:hypothetical protein
MIWSKCKFGIADSHEKVVTRSPPTLAQTLQPSSDNCDKPTAAEAASQRLSRGNTVLIILSVHNILNIVSFYHHHRTTLPVTLPHCFLFIIIIAQHSHQHYHV